MDLASTRPNKENQFVATLTATPGATQLQVVKALYGKPTAANVRALQRLQSRVKNKLLNQLYFLDHSDPRHLVSRRYQMECLDLLHKINILFAEGEYVLTERLLYRCKRLAEAGSFTPYSVECARLMCTVYSQQRQALRYQKATSQLLKLQQILAWEDEAERIYSDTQMALAHTVRSRRAVLPLLPTYIAQLEVLHRKARTFSTYNHLYRLRLAYEELQGNFKEMIKVTAEASRRFRDGKLNARRFDLRFNHFVSIYAYLRSRQPVQGLRLAEQYSRDFHPSSSNWFYFQEHHVLLALHAEQYERAQQLLSTITKNPAYLIQREAALERWDLYKAYIDFVLPPQRATARQRQMAQWVLQLPEYSRDKRGHNVAILVLQLLHFLRERSLEEVLLRLERLRKYQQRHLYEASTLRSRLFLRLLQVIVEKNFDAAGAAERGKNMLLQLQETPPPGEAFAEVEIIPYEQLWKLVLGLLREGRPLATEADA
ncbi:hypothetical protein MUN81_03530 [Hymenobacter sp. 5317J-9]|uniref:hypothetical protein n=1 Tax=Hymenobacter sp. 5317J-9 TaxID=2932250 RepID=UPI001FD6FB8E|nr:hypothetical protein [Hymenobacter sp. 5317J-9]UOQ98566.1 hypothetical protein MUN81_03530 [Hymenobacter sp. 5317J-9]